VEWYATEVAELIAGLAERPVRDPAVFYGSSSFRLWTRLAEDLDDERAVNAAFGGSTLEACAHYFDAIVPPLAPASLIVYAGDNDLGDGRSPEDVLASFTLLSERVAKVCPSIPFGFVSIKPSPARAAILERIRQTNALVRAGIERRPNGFFVPVFDAMLRAGKPRPELFVDDGLHLGPAGYDLWRELFEPFRDRMFRPHPQARSG
jgi:lysophospholipase L1-like esterase